jgi:hypothetical protein
MWTFFAGMGGRIIGIGAAILAGLGAIAAIRRSGAAAEQGKQAAREAKDDATASAARVGVDQADAAAVARRLRDWERR